MTGAQAIAKVDMFYDELKEIDDDLRDMIEYFHDRIAIMNREKFNKEGVKLMTDISMHLIDASSLIDDILEEGEDE